MACLDVGVGRSGGEEVAVRVEVERFDGGAVTRQRLDDSRRLQVPNFDGSGHAPGAHQLLGRREPHSFDRRRVPA